MAPVSSLSAAPAPIFRQYTYDNSFLNVFVSTEFATEYQISLVFARDDYDQDGHSNGIFTPRWSTDPSAIAAVKEKLKAIGVGVKVFISIGALDSTLPFNPKNNDEWIQNAIKSLKSIIQDKERDWQVDGIDIYYKHIKTDPEEFSYSVGEVIKHLKESEVIKYASISPSEGVDDKYERLYDNFRSCIDRVDYQFQYQNEVVPTPGDLVALYNKKAEVFSKEKLFAGYSAENNAWGKVSPIVFFVAALKPVSGKSKIPGASIYYNNYGD